MSTFMMRGCIFSSAHYGQSDCYYCCSKRAAARRFFMNAEFRSHSQLDEDRDVKNTEHEWEGGELYPTFSITPRKGFCISQVT